MVCVCTLCKSVGNGRVHMLSRRTLTHLPPWMSNPARARALMATRRAGREVELLSFVGSWLVHHHYLA
jgi:hypothetical protein